MRHSFRFCSLTLIIAALSIQLLAQAAKSTTPDRKSTRLNSSHGYISYAVFFFNDTATTEIYPLSLHDALPIYSFRFCSLTLIIAALSIQLLAQAAKSTT